MEENLLQKYKGENMSLRVKLKSISKIREMLEDYDGELNSDGIKFSEPGISVLPEAVEVVEFKEYALGIAIGIKKSNGSVTYISHKWIKSISDGDTVGKFNVAVELMGSKYIKIRDGLLIDINNKSLKPLSSLPICTCCGGVATNEVNGEKICDNCLIETYGKKNRYSYKPTPNFIGTQLKGDADTPTHYGIELEYGLNGQIDMAKLVFSHREEVYIKDDGSIQGGDFHAELVSHPHTFKALMDDCFIDKLPTLSAVENREANGCHIHISRTAFTDDKHYAKWYFLIHEMKTINEFVGGRELTRYCSFTPTGHIIDKGNGASTAADKSVMINERNEHTIEARFFSSTNSPDEVRSFIQYLESLIKYTKYSDDTVTVEGWRAYTKKYHKKFKNLNDKLDNYGGSFNGGVTYREPVVATRQILGVYAHELKKVTAIQLRGGKKYTGVSHVEFKSSNTEIYFHYENSRDSRQVSINKIEFVEWYE
ncbi:hypothetical protein KAU11_07330 [Candidatus Babeliales bacterium]|nr:hypothetical protein [Candidatus Babeliales bacterium]